MITKTMKLISIAALLLTAAFWSNAPDFGLALRFLVSVGAFLAAREAGRARKYYWGTGFYAVAFLFNPFLQLFTPAGTLSLLVVFATGASFVFSLYALRPQPLLSMPSITDRTPGSESL